MVSVPTVVILTGAGPTETTVSNVRFRTDDANASDLVNPCKIKATLTRSFWKNVAAKFDGTFTQITNVRFHTDGAIGWTLGTLGLVKRGNRDAGDHGVPTGNYAQATGTVNDTGNDLEVSHAYFSGQTISSANVESDTVGSPAVIDSSAITVTGTRANHVVLQAEIDTDAVQGVQATETFTFLFDEI